MNPQPLTKKGNTIMARTTKAVETVTAEEALIQMAKLILDLFGQVTESEVEAPVAKKAPVKKAAAKVAEPEDDEDEDEETEEDGYASMSLAELRKELVGRGYPAAEVKKADQATCIQSLIEDDKGDGEEDEAETEDEDAEDDVKDDADEAEDEDEDESEDEEGDWDEESLTALSLAQLKKIATDMEIEVGVRPRSASLVKLILAAQEGDDETEDEEEDEEEDDSDDESGFTAASLKGKTIKELKVLAKGEGWDTASLAGYDIDSLKELLLAGE